MPKNELYEKHLELITFSKTIGNDGKRDTPSKESDSLGKETV